MSLATRSWKGTRNLHLSIVGMIAVAILLMTGVFIADRVLTSIADDEVLADATTSAKIVAQQMQLIAERLREMGLQSIRRDSTARYRDDILRSMIEEPQIEAMWVLDSTGTSLLDSVRPSPITRVAVSSRKLRELAKRIAMTGELEVSSLGISQTGRTTGWALLGTPVVEDAAVHGIAIALVDETELLAPAGSATVSGRSFLALLVGSDTAAQTPHERPSRRQSTPVRIPLSGTPTWFVVAARSARQDAIRIGIWTVGTAVVLLLAVGLLRERRQAARMTERSIELERLSAELLRANRMKSEFLANVSHELRTPLNAIVGFVDLLHDGGYGELTDRQKVPVERVATSASRLRTLVDQILDMAKITAGRIDVRQEAVTIRPFLSNIVSEMEPLLAEKKLDIEITNSGDTTKIRTDPSHLRQILFNLIGNAVKYTERGMITLTARSEIAGPVPPALAVTGQHPIPTNGAYDRWLAIDVMDTGIGIAQGDLERIFEEFEQVKNTGKRDGEHAGTGLGLAISRRLARLLDGDITVQSEIGSGSVFTLWLPIRDENGRA